MSSMHIASLRSSTQDHVLPLQRDHQNRAGNYGGSTGTTNTGSIASAGGPMTAQEFRRAIKRDKTHYEDLTKDSGQWF
jgi:hypothetical protein